MTVENFPGGKPVVILGTDGIKLYGILVDAAGRLQVDLVNLDDIGDIATQTTLALVLARLNAIKVTRGPLAFFTRSGVLASSATWTTLIDRVDKTVVRSLILAADYGAVAMRITLDGTVYQTVDEDGSALVWPSPANIYALGGDGGLWYVARYDTTNNIYVISLQDEIRCNVSFKLQVRHQSGVNQNVGFDVVMQNEV